MKTRVDCMDLRWVQPKSKNQLNNQSKRWYYLLEIIELWNSAHLNLTRHKEFKRPIWQAQPVWMLRQLIVTMHCKPLRERQVSKAKELKSLNLQIFLIWKFMPHPHLMHKELQRLSESQSITTNSNISQPFQNRWDMHDPKKFQTVRNFLR